MIDDTVGFIQGSPSNPWETVFPKFSSEIQKQIKQTDYAQSIVKGFSTTSPVEQAALEITLMDSMNEYFEYRFITACGFPKIYLEGSEQDWEQLVDRVKLFQTLDQEEYYQKWITGLLKTVTKIAESAKGRPEIKFWRNFFKKDGGSGGPFISGWINDFFIYNQRGRKLSECNAVPYNHLTTGLSTAPFIWNCLGTELEMKFVAGFFGVAQDSEIGALRPGIGWAVINEGRKSPALIQRELSEEMYSIFRDRERRFSGKLSDLFGQGFTKENGVLVERYTQEFKDKGYEYCPWKANSKEQLLTEEQVKKYEDLEEGFRSWIESIHT